MLWRWKVYWMHLSSSMSLQMARTPDLVIGFPCSEWRLSVVRTKFPMLYDSNMPCGVMRERVGGRKRGAGGRGNGRERLKCTGERYVLHCMTQMHRWKHCTAWDERYEQVIKRTVEPLNHRKKMKRNKLQKSPAHTAYLACYANTHVQKLATHRVIAACVVLSVCECSKYFFILCCIYSTFMKREALEVTSVLWICLMLVSLEEMPVRSDSIRIIQTDTCV